MPTNQSAEFLPSSTQPAALFSGSTVQLLFVPVLPATGLPPLPYQLLKKPVDVPPVPAGLVSLTMMLTSVRAV